VHIVADAVLFDAEEAVLRPEGRPILDAVAPTLTALPNVLRVEGHANHLPVTRAASGPRTGSCRLPGHDRAHLPGRDGVPEPRMYATGYGSTQPLVPDHRPHGDHRQPARRHRRPVQRLGRGQRPAAGIDAAHEEPRHEHQREGPRPTRHRGKGGKKKLLLILARGAARGRAGAYFFLFSGPAEAAEPESSGTFLALDPVAVNLAGGGYLKIGLSLELTEDGRAGGTEARLDGSKATDIDHLHVLAGAPADVIGAGGAQEHWSRRSSRPTEGRRQMVMASTTPSTSPSEARWAPLAGPTGHSPGGYVTQQHVPHHPSHPPEAPRSAPTPSVRVPRFRR
jgi:hypothetical protein